MLSCRRGANRDWRVGAGSIRSADSEDKAKAYRLANKLSK